MKETYTKTYDVHGWSVEGQRHFQGRSRRNYWMTWRVFKLDKDGYIAESLKNPHGDNEFTTRSAAFMAAIRRHNNDQTNHLS